MHKVHKKTQKLAFKFPIFKETLDVHIRSWCSLTVPDSIDTYLHCIERVLSRYLFWNDPPRNVSVESIFFVSP